jgi:hypothetical protein
MLIYLCLLASGLVLASLITRRRWFQVVVASGILTAIAYLLLFYTGAVARRVLRPGPPAGSDADGFYLGIQQLQAALLDTYFAVLYLSAICLLTCFFRCKGQPQHSITRSALSAGD